MSLLSNVLLASVLCMALSRAEDLIVGSSTNGQLWHQEYVRLRAIPSEIRTDRVTYYSNKTIKAISAIDRDKSKATVVITAGGVGSTFVNMIISSEKGMRLNYHVQIFIAL